MPRRISSCAGRWPVEPSSPIALICRRRLERDEARLPRIFSCAGRWPLQPSGLMLICRAGWSMRQHATAHLQLCWTMACAVFVHAHLQLCWTMACGRSGSCPWRLPRLQRRRSRSTGKPQSRGTKWPPRAHAISATQIRDTDGGHTDVMKRRVYATIRAPIL